jgi:uncharacterized protein (TIGR02300 family)
LTKPELGAKRVCPNCGAKYYDLNRSPITCPKCGTTFEERVAHRAVRPEIVTAPRPVVQQEDAIELDEDTAAEDVELVPLEEVEEEEESPGKGPPFEDENEEMEEFAQDAVEHEFIEDEEEDDVAGLIEGEVEEDEEEH